MRAVLPFLILLAGGRAEEDDSTCSFGDSSGAGKTPGGRSTAGVTSELDVDIVNTGKSAISIYWGGDATNTQEVFLIAIEPGASKRVHSFAGHILEIRDEKSGELRMKHVVANGADNVLTITDDDAWDNIPDVDGGQLNLESVQGGLEQLGSDLFPKSVDYISQIPSRSREVPMGAKFRNFYPFDIEFYFDDGTEDGAYNGIIPSMGRSAINTYATHSFILCKRGTKDKFGRVTMKPKKNIIIIKPNDKEYMKDVKRTQFYKDTMKELSFMRSYQNRTGLPWLSYYPRSPPILHMWSADYIGQEHLVEIADHGEHPIKLRLKVISLRPRVFYISGLLLPEEIGHLIDISKDKVKRSSVGNSADKGFVTNTRTSRTAWIERTESDVTNRLFMRFSRVLNISDDRLTHTRNAEKLQVVQYEKGQKYSPHHDFNDRGSPPQRFLTLFMYLKSAKKDGGTGFPLAFGRRGMKVTPRDGSALLWYNMLPDGNADEMSLHEGQPVGEGEKWGCNLW
eukprot:CAMPEP_0114508428 /NCGR_PEP_ID=MMETSP0109-20121206/12595_1 /TAXON_ID=29199 /ORGANISM="Chlorarachnion reptans, Strain CCCM449" /LENGTH=509 /DNA_ID=CAMNT_0001687361 /DNA_START=249 /DNA_END=1775 /DNA_ORIENTATION=-